MAERHSASSAHSHKAKSVSTAEHKKTKTIKIKHHHAKAYRKRHYGLLLIFLILSTVLITLMVIYRNRVIDSVDNAQSYLSDVFNPTTNTQANVSSTYGFSFSYDVRTFSASAIDSASGDLFIGQELSVKRPYQTVRLSTGSTDITKNSQRSLTLDYYDNLSVSGLADQKLKDQERSVALSSVDLTKTTATIKSTSIVTIDGTQFTVNEWQLISKDTSGIGSKIIVEFRTYAGVVGGRAMVMKVTYGLNGGNNRGVFDNIVKSLKFGGRQQSALHPSKQVAEKVATNLSLIDSLLFTRIASAATSVATDSSEQISSRYSPAVVKVYNAYCMDINVDGATYLQDICSGWTGSGFFVDGNGDVATNGHVASTDPIDVVMSHAVALATVGDSSELSYLAKLSGVTDADIAGAKTLSEGLAIITDKIYSISSSRIVAVNNIDNMYVGLNEKQADLTEFVKDTENRKAYPEQDSIKKAKFVAKDYRAGDDIPTKDGSSTGFKASDVALIKIDGSNYPVTKLGSIGGVSQGASLLILGYPGQASDNGLVDNNISKPTLTAGKVSSLKTATGGSKKLIETDAIIGHGNSGGPVFDQSGNVIGIATYTIDGSGQGNGTYNYIRDIQDFKDLASKNSVTVNGTSQTQTEWNKGIDLFYKAHYSQAVKSFNKVKTLYPQHPKADELIATANDRIKNGQDVKDFPYLLVGAAVVSLLGVAGSVLLILRHRKGHNIYTGQVASGAMQPMVRGAQPQVVAYNPNTYAPTPVAPQSPVAPIPVQPQQPAMPNVSAPAPQVVAPSSNPNQQPPRPM